MGGLPVRQGSPEGVSPACVPGRPELPRSDERLPLGCELPEGSAGRAECDVQVTLGWAPFAGPAEGLGAAGGLQPGAHQEVLPQPPGEAGEARPPAPARSPALVPRPR